jgi:hypothetical protein
MITKPFNILSLLVLAFFLILMMRITIPYFTLDHQVGFLQIKQWVIKNEVWRVAFFTHVFSSIFLLLAGFTQFYSPLKRFTKVHRTIGKMYILIILFLAGPAGLIMSLYANGGILSRIAFTSLSLLWLFFTGRAWLEIRKRNFIGHGNFMIRSFALTLSALTLRAWKFLIVMIFHPHPMDGYMIVAWLGWVPNLLIAEWIIRKGMASRIIAGK